MCGHPHTALSMAGAEPDQGPQQRTWSEPGLHEQPKLVPHAPRWGLLALVGAPQWGLV